ncbi:MAG TPA: substrate-binding domain-containing protein [Nitrospira sp.]|nr:substrate-binding domain-containing protein [Nitrospira sp.]
MNATTAVMSKASSIHFHNRLKDVRVATGLSQGELASQAGVTRQAVSAIESELYLPTTAVALRLAAVLACRVEDLFSLAASDDVVEGTYIGTGDKAPTTPIRVKVTKVGKKTIVRPVAELGEVLSYTVPADGYLLETTTVKSGSMARVRISRDREAIDQEISVAGCDPAIVLAGEHLRRHKDRTSVVGWSMGSMAALEALQRSEVHVAGLHLFDPVSGESNLPFLKRALKGSAYEVVTFATWEEGFLIRPGNPKAIRQAADLADETVTLVNREEGSGARLLLDQRLRAAGVDQTKVRGYENTARSHFEVARTIAGRQADVGIGIRSAAHSFGLDFVPLQSARYDLVVAKSILQNHPTLGNLFDTISSRRFRDELEALGGYDTREAGKLHAL